MYSIIVPVLNEQETLPTLYSRLTAAAAEWDDDYEIIVVDDGSTDLTAEMLDELHRQDSRWKRISFSRNFGHQSAVSAGLRYSRGDAVAIIDGDLQDPPELLKELFQKWKQGYDVVYAIRATRKEQFWKQCAYKVFYRLMKRCANIDIPLDAGDFCVMDRRVVLALETMPEKTRFVRGLRSWTGFRQTGVAYDRSARYAGEPKYSLKKLFRLAFDGIVAFSSVPLRLASWAGVTLCGLSIASILCLIAWRLTDWPILGMHPSQSLGWTSLVSLMAFFSGLQLLMLGVIGEYLARVFDEVKGRPGWIVAELVGFDLQRLPTDPGRVFGPGDDGRLIDEPSELSHLVRQRR